MYPEKIWSVKYVRCKFGFEFQLMISAVVFAPALLSGLYFIRKKHRLNNNFNH